LYTVRSLMEKDVPGTLDKVRHAGYEHVEVAGTHGLSVKEFRKRLDESGLGAVSTHMGYEEITGNVPGVIETVQTLGARAVVVPGIDGALTPDRAGWRRCGEALNEAGRRLREAGIHLGYHNHAHEFAAIDGQYPLDIMFGAIEPGNVFAELDTFWIKFAGLSPVDVIRNYAGRCSILHLKDMADAKSRAFAEVGRGILDWPGIFEAAMAGGTRWFIVEQDVCSQDPIQSITISALFLHEQ
jgi:sugar phosphate isomerase/epimerase